MFLKRMMAAIVLATLALLGTVGEGAATDFGDDILIVSDAPGGGPNFWACLVAIPQYSVDVDPNVAGSWGATLPGLGYTTRVYTATAAGVTGPPTWTNIQSCIQFLHANAAPGDVALFVLSTHGVRACNPSVPGTVAGANYPDEVNNDWAPVDEPTGEGPGKEAPACQGLGAPAQVAGGRDGWFFTGVANNPGAVADWIRDDQLATALNGFAKHVGFIGIFDTCFAGEHADGAADVHNTLAVQHTLIMSVEREQKCPAEGFRPHLVAGLAKAPNGACAGEVTRVADAAPNGDNNCVTTASELFDFAKPLFEIVPAPVPRSGGVNPVIVSGPKLGDGGVGAIMGVFTTIAVVGASLGGAAWIERRRLIGR